MVLAYELAHNEARTHTLCNVCHMHCQGSQGQCEVRSAICGLEGSLVGGVYLNAVRMVLEWCSNGLEAGRTQCKAEV